MGAVARWHPVYFSHLCLYLNFASRRLIPIRNKNISSPDLSHKQLLGTFTRHAFSHEFGNPTFADSSYTKD